MTSFLSKELRKYYTRKGNRIVFSNGMTLGKLAWEMWERLGYSEIDPSVLSRAINGERLLSTRQLNILFQILKINKTQRKKLSSELRKDVLSKYKIEPGVLIDEETLLELIDRDSKIVKMAVRGGSPFLARNVAEISFSLISNFQGRITSEINIKNLYRKKSEILIDYVDSLFGNVDENVLVNTATPHIDEVKKIGIFLKDEKLIKIYHTLYASLNSLAGKHSLTDGEVVEGLRGGMLGEFETVTALKCAVVSSSARKDIGNLNSYLTTLLKISDRLSDSFKCTAFYSLATAEAAKGNFSKADTFIKNAWTVYNKIAPEDGYKPTRRLGIAKTELYISTLNKSFRDKKYLTNLCKNSIDIAVATGYTRVVTQFENFLANI